MTTALVEILSSLVPITIVGVIVVIGAVFYEARRNVR